MRFVKPACILSNMYGSDATLATLSFVVWFVLHDIVLVPEPTVVTAVVLAAAWMAAIMFLIDGGVLIRQWPKRWLSNMARGY